MKASIIFCIIWAVSANSEAPLNSYELPLKLSNVYGVPKIEIPATAYGVPEKRTPYPLPSPVYGVPLEAPKQAPAPIQTSVHYSIPEPAPAVPSVVYGVPAAPQPIYGVPEAPTPIYGVPIVSSFEYKLEASANPTILYGIPKAPEHQYGPPAVVYAAPPAPPKPVAEYGVPAAPSPVYGVPRYA